MTEQTQQTAEQFDALPLHVQRKIQAVADIAGASPLSVDWSPYLDTPELEPDSPETRLARSWAKTNEQRAHSAAAAPADLPTQAEAEALAAAYGVDAGQIHTAERQSEIDAADQARADAAALDIRLNAAIAARDVVELERIGNGAPGPAREAARDAMADVLPSFAYWKD